MAMIFSPLDEGTMEGPYRPLPRGVFLMQQLGRRIFYPRSSR